MREIGTSGKMDVLEESEYPADFCRSVGIVRTWIDVYACA